MKSLKRWGPELLSIAVIGLTVWILNSQERIEILRAWSQMLLSLAKRLIPSG